MLLSSTNIFAWGSLHPGGATRLFTTIVTTIAMAVMVMVVMVMVVVFPATIIVVIAAIAVIAATGASMAFRIGRRCCEESERGHNGSRCAEIKFAHDDIL